MFIYETARCTEVSADRQNSTNSISFLPPLFNKTNFQAVAPTASCLLRFLLQAFQPQYFYLHMFMRIILLSRRAWRHLNIIITNSVYLWALWISSSPLSHLNITITNSVYLWAIWISPSPIQCTFEPFEYHQHQLYVPPGSEVSDQLSYLLVTSSLSHYPISVKTVYHSNAVCISNSAAAKSTEMRDSAAAERLKKLPDVAV